MSEKRENTGYVFVAAVSAFFLFWAIPTFTPPYPGYGVSAALMPNIAASTMLALAILGLGRNLLARFRQRRRERTKEVKIEKQEDRVHPFHLLRFLLPAALLMPAMAWLGFLPAGFLFLILLQYWCDQRRPLVLITVAAVTTGTVYVIMRYGLSAPMP